MLNLKKNDDEDIDVKEHYKYRSQDVIRINTHNTHNTNNGELSEKDKNTIIIVSVVVFVVFVACLAGYKYWEYRKKIM